MARAARTVRLREGRPGAASVGRNGAFASLVSFGATRIGISSDGVGTKVELAERLGVYRTIGFDLVAMVVDDLASNGFEPTSLSNILDVDRLDERVVDELMGGLCEAAERAAVVLTGGEIAELGARVAGFGEGMHFNWSATALGLLPEPLAAPIDGSRCRPGDAIVAVAEEGLRSNGFTLARSILTRAYGADWHDRPCAVDDARRSWGELLLTASRICCRLVADSIAAGVVPHGVAHITGGGIPSKLGRVLCPSRLGAVLDRLPEPPPFMLELAAMGAVARSAMVHHWNLGAAMLLVVAPRDVAATIGRAEQRGHRALAVGTVVARPVITLWHGPAAVTLDVGERESPF